MARSCNNMRLKSSIPLYSGTYAIGYPHQNVRTQLISRAPFPTAPIARIDTARSPSHPRRHVRERGGARKRSANLSVSVRTLMPMSEYKPQVSPERVEQLKQWHETTSAALHELGSHDVEYLGLDLHVPEQVFPPTPTSDLLGDQVRQRVQSGDRVLDMGCGAGANAILAAQVTDKVVAVDVNPIAVAATAANAERNGVRDRVAAKVSDLFDEVDGDFDVIVFDPPFRWFPPRDLLERAFTDENYRSLGRFMHEVSSRLRPGGEVLLFFGTSGDVMHLDNLIESAGLSSEYVAERTISVRGENTTYFVRSVVARTA